MPKPTNLAKWATLSGAGGGTITEPSNLEKETGWPDGGWRPPGQWFNWWMNAVYLWVIWLDAFESTAHTWTAAQTFNAPVTFAVSGTDVEFVDGFHSSGSAEFDLNVIIGTALDVGGDFTVSGDSFFDNADVATLLTAAAATISGTLTSANIATGATISGTQPTTTTAQTNQLNALTLCKAQVFFQGSGGASPTVHDGVNIATITQDADGKFIVTLGTPMANNTYSVIAYLESGFQAKMEMFYKSAADGSGGKATIELYVQNSSDNARRDRANTSGYKVSVLVFGRQ